MLNNIKFIKMLQNELGKQFANLDQRQEYLNSVCDGQESVSYTRIFTTEELAEQRELLTDASIMLADIERTKKQALADFKDQAKPWEDQKQKAIESLRTKSEVVEEDCYKVLDEETKMVGFYNSNGDLVSSRGAFASELQKTIFAEFRKTGTHDQ